MKIKISKEQYEKIINHCTRKLQKIYTNDETHEQQAFGGIVAKRVNDEYVVTKVYNLKKNYRFDKRTSIKMNSLLNEYAIPGDLNIEERAWSIDPIELNEILINLDTDEEFIGTYHMHHDKSWNSDYPKELASDLDRKLAKDTELINFIVYIGNEKKGIRAFYESLLDKEYLVFMEG